MIELREIIQKEVWEQFILECQETPFYQSWIWGDIEEMNGQEVYRFGIFNNEELVGICLAIIINSKRGRFMQIRYGPLFKSWSWDVFDEMFTLLEEQATDLGVQFIRIGLPLEQNDDNLLKMQKRKFKLRIDGNREGIRTLTIDLSESEEEILAKMRKSTRYNIRKAIKDEIEVSSTFEYSEELVNQFSTILRKTSKHEGYLVSSNLEKEIEHFLKNQMGVIIFAKSEDKVVAAGFYLLYGNQANSFYRAVPREGVRVKAAEIINWEAIKLVKTKGLKTFNLWGVVGEEDKNHPWFGFSSFKRGFSQNEKIYLQVHDKPLSFKYKFIRLYEWLMAKRQGYL